MNLHSGIENVHHLLWGVSAGAGALSTGLFIAFVRSMRRFHFSQQRSVDSTAALDRAIDALCVPPARLLAAHVTAHT